MSEERENRGSDTNENGKGAILKSHGRSLEITGLGVVASLALAFWSLVSDGTLLLSQYLVFLSFLSISAGGMVWRILKLTPDGRSIAEKRLKPGVYRVSFRGR